MKTLIVTDGNKRTIIDVADVLFFSARPPYIHIHHKAKGYLYRETLKSLSSKLDSGLFIREHKSAIVNMMKVQSYKSRLNGDYDLTMVDGTEIRLSRNFAPAFKEKFESSHQDTTK